MDSMHLIGCNTKYYRFQKNLTKEKFAEMPGFKMAYLSTIENGETAKESKNLPTRVDKYYKNLKK